MSDAGICKRCGSENGLWRKQPTCKACREYLIPLRRKAWKMFVEMGYPGDWHSFFSLYSGEPMPEIPKWLELQRWVWRNRIHDNVNRPNIPYEEDEPT